MPCLYYQLRRCYLHIMLSDCGYLAGGSLDQCGWIYALAGVIAVCRGGGPDSAAADVRVERLG
jgi:hypothetical protein